VIDMAPTIPHFVGV